MNSKDIKNSVFLIGPSCVGKSLLSEEIGQKLNMPVVCIDDLITFVQWENDGYIGVSKQKQEYFISICNEELKDDADLKKNLKDKNLRKAQINRASEILKLYKKYVKLYGSLKPFRYMIKEYNKLITYCGKDIEKIVTYSALSSLIIKMSTELLSGPVVFDTPAMFGWKIDENKIGSVYRRCLLNSKLKIKLSNIEHYQNKILKYSNTVFLEPGKDYKIRNSAKNDPQNKILLNNIENYMDYANIMVTTNNFFNQPKNKYFEKRSWFDVKEIETKEKLKDKCNISNVCDEIVTLIDENKQMNNLNLID